MNMTLTFKDLMHEPMIIDGKGKSEKLAEIIGDNNVNRLANLGIIKVSDGEFSVTENGKKVVNLFNMKRN
jgi:hypothetical protein